MKKLLATITFSIGMCLSHISLAQTPETLPQEVKDQIITNRKSGINQFTNIRVVYTFKNLGVHSEKAAGIFDSEVKTHSTEIMFSNTTPNGDHFTTTIVSPGETAIDKIKEIAKKYHGDFTDYNTRYELEK